MESLVTAICLTDVHVRSHYFYPYLFISLDNFVTASH